MFFDDVDESFVGCVGAHRSRFIDSETALDLRQGSDCHKASFDVSDDRRSKTKAKLGRREGGGTVTS